MKISYHISPSAIQKVAELAELAWDGSDLDRNTIKALKRIAKEAGDDGWVVVYNQPHIHRKRKWTRTEEALFVARILSAQRRGGWKIPGNQKKVWEEMAVEFDRPASSLKNKYAQLLRRGVVKDVS